MKWCKLVKNQNKITYKQIIHKIIVIKLIYIINNIQSSNND